MAMMEEEKDPLLEHDDDHEKDAEKDDEKYEHLDHGDGDSGFPEEQEMRDRLKRLRERSRSSSTAETSYIEEDLPDPKPDPPKNDLTTIMVANDFLKKEFPFAKLEDLNVRMENNRVKVGLFRATKKGVKTTTYFLTTRDTKTNKFRINPALPKEITRELGKSRRETIDEKIGTLSQDIYENKKFADDEKQSPTEREKARERAKRQIAERTDLQRELERLENNDYESIDFESIPLQEFEKNEEQRTEKEKEIQQEKEKQKEIVNDENAPSDEREHARENVERLVNEENQIEAERERDLERLSFRERVREKIKNVFKKYGFTVTAILIAAGILIMEIVKLLTKPVVNAVKAFGKALGNGLKDLGKKILSVLPGLLGSIVSFLFTTAGKVLGFLAEHAWLVILAVVAFLIERLTKKQS